MPPWAVEVRVTVAVQVREAEATPPSAVVARVRAAVQAQVRLEEEVALATRAWAVEARVKAAVQVQVQLEEEVALATRAWAVEARVKAAEQGKAGQMEACHPLVVTMRRRAPWTALELATRSPVVERCG